MTTYIVRRALIMIPTLIGMTFLLFMLISLAPGDFSMALSVSGGGQMEASSRAATIAYYEDRYGLNDPIIVQYGRWLGRISPLKFGVRDQRTDKGELVRPPREVRKPALWKLFIDDLPNPPPPDLEAFAPGQEPARVYRLSANDYARTRTTYLSAATRFEVEAGRVLREQSLDKFVADDGRLDGAKPAGFEGFLFTTQRLPSEAVEALKADPDVERTFGAAVTAYTNALASRNRIAASFATKPHPEAGMPLIPRLVWLGKPDFGISVSRSRPVGALIAEALPVTLLLNAIAVPIIYFVAIPSGMLAAVRQGTWFDIASGALFVALWSVPIVWACVLALGYLANETTGLGLFPVIGLHSDDADAMRFLPSFAGGWRAGFLLDTLHHCVLPVACLTYAGFAVLSKQTRAAMLDNFNADYVRTAKAKGVSEKDVIFRHVFRNSLLPLITMFVTIFPAMLGGSVIVERVFSVPGMGSLLIDAIYLRDREVLLANAAIVGMVNMFALLLADVLYAVADPRISYK